ncbi:MAG: nuclear transport factor 2 family protein [Pseudomonadota bacterium]
MDAHSEIMRLLNRYCYAIDTGDFDDFVELFAKASWTTTDAPAVFTGREEIAKEVVGRIKRYEDGTPKTKHIMSNIQLDIDEAAGTAKGQRYVTVIQATDALPLQPIFAAHYYDEFVREDGKWRFASTNMDHALAGDLSHHVMIDEIKEEHGV